MNKITKKIEYLLIAFVGSIFLGTTAFAEREIEYDYAKALETRNQMDKVNIENYSKQNNVSIEVATKKYLTKLQEEFKNNEKIREEFIKNNSRG